MLNLAPFKLDISIAFENDFIIHIPNFGIGVKKWHCIGDALYLNDELVNLVFPTEHLGKLN